MGYIVIIVPLFQNFYYEANRGAGHKRVTVNATGCGFDLQSGKLYTRHTMHSKFILITNTNELTKELFEFQSSLKRPGDTFVVFKTNKVIPVNV